MRTDRSAGSISLEQLVVLGLIGMVGVAGVRSLGTAFDAAIAREGAGVPPRSASAGAVAPVGPIVGAQAAAVGTLERLLEANRVTSTVAEYAARPVTRTARGLTSQGVRSVSARIITGAAFEAADIDELFRYWRGKVGAMTEEDSETALRTARALGVYGVDDGVRSIESLVAENHVRRQLRTIIGADFEGALGRWDFTVAKGRIRHHELEQHMPRLEQLLRTSADGTRNLLETLRTSGTELKSVSKLSPGKDASYASEYARRLLDLVRQGDAEESVSHRVAELAGQFRAETAPVVADIERTLDGIAVEEPAAWRGLDDAARESKTLLGQAP